VYSKYYEQHQADRNDLLGNAEVAFQTFAFDRANIGALRKMELDRDKARILDVGCGSGAGLIQFLRLGFRPDQLSGIDISPERIDDGRRSLPNVDFKCESAATMSYASGAFDIVFESTMFVLLPLGRLLSHRAPSLYFMVQALLPPAVGQMTTVLRKR
jgi:SAM-dependent methyltransferase